MGGVNIPLEEEENRTYIVDMVDHFQLAVLALLVAAANLDGVSPRAQPMRGNQHHPGQVGRQKNQAKQRKI